MNVYWERIERILAEQGMSINGFAKYIGLPRGENLYQIKRGNNRISLGVARRIHAHFPQYAISWLLTGEEGSMPALRVETVHLTWLPYYESIEDTSSTLLPIPTFLSKGAQMILRCKDDREQRMGFMPRPLLLLRRIELCEMDENNSYYIMTDKLQGVFTVRADARTSLVRLESVWNTYIAEIHANDIRCIWCVCNFIADME